MCLIVSFLLLLHMVLLISFVSEKQLWQADELKVGNWVLGLIVLDCVEINYFNCYWVVIKIEESRVGNICLGGVKDRTR